MTAWPTDNWKKLCPGHCHGLSMNLKLSAEQYIFFVGKERGRDEKLIVYITNLIKAEADMSCQQP